MAELWFVGLGLGDERGLSRHAFDVLARADRIFAEEYTATAPPGTIERLADELGRPIDRIDRASLEAEEPILVALRDSPRVALLVVGDPFAATTHVALRVAVERAGHAWRYVPAASVLTAAAGYLGLMHYRFGRTVSLPFPEPGFAPRSPVEQIAENRQRGLHTLLLLDLRPSEGRYLTADRALGILRERDPEGFFIPPNALVAVAARLGRDDAAAWLGRLDRLVDRHFGPPPHVVVVLAPSLHFEESAALGRYSIDLPVSPTQGET